MDRPFTLHGSAGLLAGIQLGSAAEADQQAFGVCCQRPVELHASSPQAVPEGEAADDAAPFHAHIHHRCRRCRVPVILRRARVCIRRRRWVDNALNPLPPPDLHMEKLGNLDVCWMD